MTPAETQKQRVALRRAAFENQGGRCYWCFCHMDRPIRPGEPHNPMSCTAEHLIRKFDGGKCTADNIVAACKQCNASREEYPDRRPRVRVKAVTRPHVPGDVPKIRRKHLGKWDGFITGMGWR